MQPTGVDAAVAGLVAFAVAATLTPVSGRLARRIGAVDQPRARGLAVRPTPLLGGLAIFAGTFIAGVLFLPDDDRFQALLAGATVITIVGAIDDWRELPASWKLAGEWSPR